MEFVVSQLLQSEFLYREVKPLSIIWGVDASYYTSLFQIIFNSSSHYWFLSHSIILWKIWSRTTKLCMLYKFYVNKANIICYISISLGDPKILEFIFILYFMSAVDCMRKKVEWLFFHLFILFFIFFFLESRKSVFFFSFSLYLSLSYCYRGNRLKIFRWIWWFSWRRYNRTRTYLSWATYQFSFTKKRLRYFNWFI